MVGYQELRKILRHLRADRMHIHAQAAQWSSRRSHNAHRIVWRSHRFSTNTGTDDCSALSHRSESFHEPDTIQQQRGTTTTTRYTFQEHHALRHDRTSVAGCCTRLGTLMVSVKSRLLSLNLFDVSEKSPIASTISIVDRTM